MSFDEFVELLNKNFKEVDWYVENPRFKSNRLTRCEVVFEFRYESEYEPEDRGGMEENQDNHKQLCKEAVKASNEEGFTHMSVADVIRYQAAEIERLKEYHYMYKNLCE